MAQPPCLLTGSHSRAPPTPSGPACQAGARLPLPSQYVTFAGTPLVLGAASRSLIYNIPILQMVKLRQQETNRSKATQLVTSRDSNLGPWCNVPALIWNRALPCPQSTANMQKEVGGPRENGSARDVRWRKKKSTLRGEGLGAVGHDEVWEGRQEGFPEKGAGVEPDPEGGVAQVRRNRKRTAGRGSQVLQAGGWGARAVGTVPWAGQQVCERAGG